MATLTIKHVDFAKLDKQRLSLLSAMKFIPDGSAKDDIDGILNMLDFWSDDYQCSLAEPKENQKAKESQMSIFQYKVCLNCGWEGIGGICQSCGSAALERQEDPK